MNKISRRAWTAAAVSLASPVAAIADTSAPRIGGIAYHYVGRVSLNFLTVSSGVGVVYGYVSALAGIDSTAALFNGSPSEASAYLTFRADIKFQALPPNGPLGPGQFAVTPILVEPGVWSIYFTPNPAHIWDNPGSFSNGIVVAVMDRALEQFSVFPTFSINAGAAVPTFTMPFTLAGRSINLRDLMPRGTVNITSGSPIPLSGSTPTSPIFGFSGYALAAGQ